MAKKEDNLRKGNPEHAFTKENQPTPEAKSMGQKKHKLLKDIASMPVNDVLFAKIKEAADMLGLKQEDIDIELAMHLKQMQLAAEHGDTKAYNAVLDRLKGKPKQEVASDIRIIGLDSLTNTQIEDEIKEIESRG